MINLSFLSNTFFERSVCMHPEQYEDRKRYIKHKKRFATSGQPLNANEQAGDNNRSEKSFPHVFMVSVFFLHSACFLPFLP